MSKQQKTTLIQTQTSLPRKIAVTTGIMLVLILLVYGLNVPNPNMILIAGLVLCSALYGFGGGIIAALIMFLYTLFFFSTDQSFVRFTPENLQKVGVSLVGITADMLLVCLVKRAELQAFRRVEELTEELHRENERLHSMSLTDALTGIRNRMALRQDYDSYRNDEVTVMMLDLNDFKRINDSCGHEEGDRILRETAALLEDSFGCQHCYRYGGDEFLVIVPELSEAAFEEKLDVMQRRKPKLTMNGTVTEVDFSVGYVHARLSEKDRLRELIAAADERMYQKKRDKGRAAAPPRPAAAKEPAEQRVKATEYTVTEMKTLLDKLSGRYDLARVVDPIECRILEIQADGKIVRSKSCYSIWNAEQKCINCSSAVACQTGCHQEKAERFRDEVYHIQSDPVTLKLPDGGAYDAVVELVSIEPGQDTAATHVNNRAAENIGNRAAHYQAQHDSLTKVLNAGAFYELAREEIVKHRDRAWVMVTADIMNFRLVNTLFGVARGNEVLVRTAAGLRELAESADGLCSRLSGDRFALLFPQERYSEQALRELAQDLAEVFNRGIYFFRIHFGVYRVEDASIPVSVMCDRADSALRTIREDLSETVAYFDGAIRKKSLAEQTVISTFEDALRDGEYHMYLQPLVGQDGHILGAEALARWHRPDGSIVGPGEFVETLERAGLIQKLDVYIWELAVRQLSAWKGTDKEQLTISVNMSAKDFYSIDVYEVLSELVERYQVDCRMLRLEITETALLVEPDKSDAVVSRLREKGFLVEIDDFGKGYSSLSLLKNIQADVLKIDMSFLHEIKDRERSRVILKSVINMADSLGMEVISEGVETQRQLDALTSMGCSLFQGFYFSRPVPVEEFERKVDALR